MNTMFAMKAQTEPVSNPGGRETLRQWHTEGPFLQNRVAAVFDVLQQYQLTMYWL